MFRTAAISGDKKFSTAGSSCSSCLICLSVVTRQIEAASTGSPAAKCLSSANGHRDLLLNGTQRSQTNFSMPKMAEDGDFSSAAARFRCPNLSHLLVKHLSGFEADGDPWDYGPRDNCVQSAVLLPSFKLPSSLFFDDTQCNFGVSYFGGTISCSERIVLTGHFTVH